MTRTYVAVALAAALLASVCVPVQAQQQDWQQSQREGMQRQAKNAQNRANADAEKAQDHAREDMDHTQQHARDDMDRMQQQKQGMQDRQLTDQTIQQAVERELRTDQGLQDQTLNVKVNNGTVTLSGKLDSASAEDRAIRLAETVRGVRNVQDQIQVQPKQQMSDEQLTQHVRSSLQEQQTDQAKAPDVKVQDGVVILSGTSPNLRQSESFARAARETRGVREVRNEIKVQPAEQRSDQQITQDIKDALNWDRRVDNQQIEVSVSDGKVDLSGTVGSAAERRRAGETAFIEGVTQVDVSKLQVEPKAQRQQLRGQKYSQKSDREIQQAAQKSLERDPQLKGQQIQTQARSGQITLNGTVSSQQTKRRAEQALRDLVGVRSVQNNLQVRPDQQQAGQERPNQQQLTQRVQQALQRDPYLQADQIDVQAQQDGTIQLSGKVDTFFEKGRADHAAAQVRGVQQVQNRLQVMAGDQPLTYDPYVDREYTRSEDWYDYQRPQQGQQGQERQQGQMTRQQTPANQATDDFLVREINEEMWWSPFVDEDNVNVSVQNGVATLTGSVEDWSERDAAVENAYEGGATWVIDQLTIRDRQDNNRNAND